MRPKSELQSGSKNRHLHWLLFGACLLGGIVTASAQSGGTVVGWGANSNGQATPPVGLNNVTAIAAGDFYGLALKNDGAVVGWGSNSSGQTTTPAGLSNVTAIAAGGNHSLALKSDGTVTGWGYDCCGQTAPPAGLSSVIAIAAGGNHSLALKSDGTVVAWGYNGDGETTPPAGLSNVIAIAGGGYHSLALKSDGTVVGWGYNGQGQTTTPAGLTNVIAIAAGDFHSLALKSDGTVVGWGYNANGQTATPAGLSNVTAIAAGGAHSLALKGDGTVVGWGNNANGQTTPPAALVNVTAIGAGSAFSFALVSHISPVVTNTSDSGAGSLRQALLDAQDGDTITFNIPTADPGFNAGGWTINLTSGQLVVDDSIKISGPGASLLTVQRDSNAAAFRIFYVNLGHTVTIEGLTISGGIAQGNAFQQDAGGGIFNDHSIVTVNGCTITGNYAQNYGAGIWNDAYAYPGTASLTVTNSTLSNNICGGAGGGIYNFGESTSHATLTVSNTTFSGNTSVGGGGIFNDGTAGTATLNVANCTFHNNTAPNGSGSGSIYNDGNSGGIATIQIGNTILDSPDGGILNVNGTVTSAGYNLISDAGVTNYDAGTGAFNATGDQINTDAMLGPLKDNGGPTLTHAPLINSPAIDRGKRDTIPALTTNFDQRGLPRPVDDPAVADASGGDTSDIGAVELAVGVHPTSAASWKTHGAGSFAVDLPMTGPVGIECRSGGASNTYQIITTFAQPVSFSTAALTKGTGSVLGSSVSPDGLTIIADLTGITNQQTITLALFDVSDGTNRGDIGIRVGVLAGDTNKDGRVNVGDTDQTKSLSGADIGLGENYRNDVNLDGRINIGDTNFVKTHSGSFLP